MKRGIPSLPPLLVLHSALIILHFPH